VCAVAGCRTFQTEFSLFRSLLTKVIMLLDSSQIFQPNSVWPRLTSWGHMERVSGSGTEREETVERRGSGSYLKLVLSIDRKRVFSNSLSEKDE